MYTERNSVESRDWLRYAALLVILLFIAVFLAGCTQPTKVVETDPGYEVKRLNDKAWATTDSGQPNILLLLTDSVWHNLVGKRMATTDSNGQAQIKGTDCEELYVYKNSGLVMSECPKGGGTGGCSTGTMEIKNCKVTIRTMPADVSAVGTWFWVTYLEDAQTTLVIVIEGRVTVTPATQLDFKLVDREQLQYEVTTRELGQAVDVVVGAGDKPRFLYTASDGRVTSLKEQGAPEARVWLEMEELPALHQILIPYDQNLNPWLEQIQDRVIQGGIEFPELPLDQSGATLVYLVNGEARPGLAESWAVSDDGKQWIFYLNKNRQMPDGTPYTAEFIEKTLATDRQGAGRISAYAGMERIDDYTVMIVLSEPNPNLLKEVSEIALSP